MAMRALVILILACLAAPALAGQPGDLPPPTGPETPRVAPIKGDDGLYHQSWFVDSLLDLRQDFGEAKATGRRFAVIFEQRGCAYCVKMHTDVLARKYINDYVRENFRVVQLNLWGDREVTDFDGTRLTEKKLAERWGILFTPTIVYFKQNLVGAKGRDLEVLRMSLGVGPGTFYDMFTWIRHKVYEKDRNFQRFHVGRYNEREALKSEKAKAGKRAPVSH